MSTKIIRAREGSLVEINSLIARSKSLWNWPREYLEHALPLHEIKPSYVQNNHCFEILNEQNELVAFFSVEASPERVWLDNLWVTPDLIGTGLGRQACEYVLRLAREQGWQHLWVLPDPPAAGFYLKLGFSDTGERVPSRVPGGPLFSVLHIQL